MRVAVTIALSAKERLTKGRSSPLGPPGAGGHLLWDADGLENQDIAARLGKDKMKVGRWRQRYGKGSFAAILKDKTRPGRIELSRRPGLV